MKIQRKTNKHQDATAYCFNLGYDDIELYSITVVDAYRTPTAKIVTKEELDKFLNDSERPCCINQSVFNNEFASPMKAS